MAGPWLYPISAQAGRFFRREGQEPVPVTVESYRDFVESGQIVEVVTWRIKQNRANIEVGDEVFIYSGDGDVGIIGYFTVAAVEQDGEGWFIRPLFNLDRCLALLDRPVAATVVLGWGVVPRAAVTNLAAWQAELCAQLPWGAQAIAGGEGP
jgi:hypothetical protein